MSGRCRKFWSLSARMGPCRWIAGIALFVVSAGCGGEQRSGAAPADSTQPARTDTSVVGDTAVTPVTDTTRAVTPDSAVTRRDTARSVAATPPRQRPPRPRTTPPARPARVDTATPDTTPASPARTDTVAATGTDTASPTTPPTDTATTAAPTAQANAPLRDEYHRAPLDTVTQQVYDGWKQYNLNCARCHGEDVLGTTIAPHLLVSLKPNGPINTKELFVQTVCAGRPAKGMPAWCPLGMEMPTIEAIYAYVKARTDAKVRPGRPALRAGG